MDRKAKIALGGGCHWCTEAVFQSLRGVVKVEQGYVASAGENDKFSEAVIVHFDGVQISLKTLVKIHLYTHKSSSMHSMRHKYRSAIYTFSKQQSIEAERILKSLQLEFDNEIITKVYPFSKFKASRQAIQNYYQKNPEKPFCKTFINPKLILLLQKFSDHVNNQKVKHLKQHV